MLGAGNGKKEQTMRVGRSSKGRLGTWLLCSLILLSSLGGVHGGQFHPNKSISFINEEQLFKVEYLDDASLTGFVAEDVVQLGHYWVSTRFGCVTKSKGHDWAQADGILGMGFPAAALRSVPFPLFWALTDQTKVSLDNSNILVNRIFTLMLSQDRGELVLGGHDPTSVKGKMVTTNVRASALADGSEAFMHYMIDVQSLKVGGHELLQFKDKSIAIQAILDSGTSCLVVPDDTFGGGLLASPFKTFQKHFGDLDEPTIYITIEGQTFELPYDDYMVDDKPCVMKMKSTPRTFLLGDVFFRRMVVSHNLNNPLRPQITLGQRDPDYKLTTTVKKVGDHSHIPLGKKAVQRPMPETEHAVTSPATRQGARIRAGDNVADSQAAVAASVHPIGLQPSGSRQEESMYQRQEAPRQMSKYQVASSTGEVYQPGIGSMVGVAGPEGGGGQQTMQRQEPLPMINQQAAAQYGGYVLPQPRFAQAEGYQPNTQPFQQAPQYPSAQNQYLQQPMVPPHQEAAFNPEQMQMGAGAQQVQQGPWEEEAPLHNPSAGAGRRLLASTTEVDRIPMTTSNSYIYYASLEVGTPRQKNIHVILDTGSSVFAIFAVPHGGPSILVICLLVAACILGATSIGLLALSWYQGTYEELEVAEGMDPLLGGQDPRSDK